MAKHALSPGSDEPLHIFQDDNFENSTPMTSHAPMPAFTKPARRPLGATNSNVVLKPPVALRNAGSPHKMKPSSPRSPLKAQQWRKLNRMPMAPPGQGHHTDSLQKKPFLSNFKTGSQRMSHDLNGHWGNENAHIQIFPAPSPSYSVENPTNANGKRVLMDAAPIMKDSRPSKKPKVAEPASSEVMLPAHDSFPPIIDDGTKPAHSYAQLIGMAILRSPNRRLTLSQIYKWISENYSFYSPHDAGWQNSIRHNLSLHKNFKKMERPKDDPGKGNYWAIEPGTEGQFLKEKPTRKSAPSAENLPVMSTRLEPSGPAPAPTSEPALPPYAPSVQTTAPPPPQSRAMPSSDGTIPESDSLVPEEAGDKSAGHDLGFDSSLYSPMPHGINSSPPIARVDQGTSGTPQANPSSVTRPRKRPADQGVDDSGYISSLDSSVQRPVERATTWTSGSNRPRKKRAANHSISGRAEVEIARIRNSSPFSPTKSRSKPAYQPTSSSPLRQSGDVLGPLTPNVKLKPPVQHPPSVSPNTNLRVHRNMISNMLQTPLFKQDTTELPWSPEFNLDENMYIHDFGMGLEDNNGLHGLSGFNDDIPFDFLTGSVDIESPIRNTAQRMRLGRSASAIDLPTSTKKSITSAPKFADMSPMRFLETPSKALEGLGSPSKLFDQSPSKNPSPSKFLEPLDLPADDNWLKVPDQSPTRSKTVDIDDNGGVSEMAGFDILQGFQKIGSQTTSGSQATSSHGAKPSLDRSYTARF